MTSDITPDAIRAASFRTAFRGHDPSEVASLLEAVARRIEELESEHNKLKAQAADSVRADMATEFDRVGQEVSAILQTARTAAESMRERASQEVERWRSEAQEEAAVARREAHADAEALRRDAWVVGTEVLEQAQTAAEAMRADAERDVLTVMGEAEREAHRLTSGSRREAEDLVRGANVEAERIITVAAARRDEIIDGANRQAATAQERTRALETRREELLAELENVRSTLTRMEGSLEERKEALDLAAKEPTNVRVVHPPAEAKQEWELGETVRVIQPEDDEDQPAPPSAEEMRDEVARIQEQGPVSTSPEPSLDQPEPQSRRRDEPARPDPDLETPHQTSARAEPEPRPETHPDAEPASQPQSQQGLVASQPEAAEAPGPDDLDALFAALRSTPEPETQDREASADAPVDDVPSGQDDSVGTDWIAMREASLIPITNRGLRGIKKVMTEMQNVALDSLRTEGDWRLEPGAIVEAIHADLVTVWTESFSAGHAAAEQMAGDRLKRPDTPPLTEDRRLAEDLAAAVGNALDGAGEGSRERQSAVSKVFRVWRSDEAERRLRDLALLGYETGIEMSRSVPAE